MRKETELQIMDPAYVSIEKVAEQFLVERKEIENKDGLHIAFLYIPTLNNFQLIYCIVLIKENITIIIRKKRVKIGSSK